jgi:hypothetical protein
LILATKAKKAKLLFPNEEVQFMKTVSYLAAVDALMYLATTLQLML